MTNIIRYFFSMGNLKNGTNELFYKTEIESQMQKINMVSSGEWEKGKIRRLGLTYTDYYMQNR